MKRGEKARTRTMSGAMALAAVLLAAPAASAQTAPAGTAAAPASPSATPSPPATPAPDPLASVLAEARALINEGKAAAAIPKLRALDVASPRVAHLLGVAYYHADDHVHAIEVLKPVVDRLPEGSLERKESVQVLGLSLYLAEHLAESIPYLEQTRSWAPDNNELAYVLGNAYLQTRQPDKARESFARLFRVPADSAAAHLLTAQMMSRLELEDAAEAELRKALDKDPRLPQANFLLAQADIFRSRFDDAVAHLEKELEVNPTNAMAFWRLGDLYTRQNKWDEAIAALQKSLWLNPNFSGPYILLGRAYMRKGQPRTAEGMLRQAIAYDPNNKAAHYLLGQLLQQMGRAEEAKGEFEIAERLQGEPERR